MYTSLFIFFNFLNFKVFYIGINIGLSAFSIGIMCREYFMAVLLTLNYKL